MVKLYDQALFCVGKVVTAGPCRTPIWFVAPLLLSAAFLPEKQKEEIKSGFRLNALFC